MGQVVIELELPFPPSVNHYYRRVGPRTLLSREGRRYRERVAAVVAELGLRPLAGPLEAEVLVFPPDRRRRDLDNLQKAVWDSLQHAGVYERTTARSTSSPLRAATLSVAAGSGCGFTSFPS